MTTATDVTRIPCKACSATTRGLLAFCDPCRDNGNAAAWTAQNPPAQREHAPGHPYGAQAGPGGMHARFCLLPGCGWRDTVGGTA